MFGLEFNNGAGLEPPTVPARKEKRIKVKQDIKAQPYTAIVPSWAHVDERDKLERELQLPEPYMETSSSSDRLSPQDKLQRERLRMVGRGAGTQMRTSRPESTVSLPPSYRSTSPAPTFTSTSTTLPPYSAGPRRLQDSRPQLQERTQRDEKAGRSLFRRLSRASVRSGSRVQENVDVPVLAGSRLRPLPPVPQGEEYHGVAGGVFKGMFVEDSAQGRSFQD